MKRLLLFGCSLFAAFGFAQTTIYQENFETGNTFTMNTTDLGGASTSNTWLMNNSFTGGSGTIICIGFPFTFTVANTPAQPGGITGSPSSNYMHISAQAAISSGITCASFIPSDGGTCVSNESNFSKMTAPISTLGFTGVSLDFWWMCAGSPDNFGEVYYSTNGGTTWTLKQSNMQNVTNWTQTALVDPAWDNQASLLFAYRFVNNTAATAADPSFSVDEILVTGMGASNTIFTIDIQPQPSWCFGDITTLQVSFEALGTYNVGNVFTAELSDASGSFAAPTVIGSYTSSMSGTQLIPAAVVPGTIPAGTGYRIRVVASDPATIGSDNGSDLTIHPLPTVTLSSFSALCSNGTPVALTGGSPAGGSYTGNGVSGGNFDPSLAGSGSTNITYSFVDVNGCLNTATETILVNQAPAVTLSAVPNLCDYNPDYTLVATPSGGTFAGPGVTGNMFSPSTAGIGTHTITYDYTDPTNGCSDQASQTALVDACASLTEETIVYSIYPNPAEGYFSVISDVEFESIELRDLNGRLVQKLVSNEQVNVSSLSSGIYIVELTHLGQRYTERIMLK